MRGLQFSSTYERNGGGTSWHWLGTSLRELENDIQFKTKYGVMATTGRWTYTELQELWAQAEKEIGVAASVAQQEPLEVVGLKYPPGYQYPMQADPDEHRRSDRQHRRGRTASAGHAADNPTAQTRRCTMSSLRRRRKAATPSRTRIAASAPATPTAFPSVPSRPSGIRPSLSARRSTPAIVTVSYQSVAYNIAVEGKNATRIDYLRMVARRKRQADQEKNR